MSSFTACEIRRELFLLPHLRVAHLRRRWRPHGSSVRKSSGGGRKSTIDMVRTAGLLPLGGPCLDLRVVDDDGGSTTASSSPPAGATSSELEGRSLYTTGSASTAATSPGCVARACRRRSINGGWDWDSERGPGGGILHLPLVVGEIKNGICPPTVDTRQIEVCLLLALFDTPAVALFGSIG
jgi:hypothetical protein